jgi:hypothetical protein
LKRENSAPLDPLGNPDSEPTWKEIIRAGRFGLAFVVYILCWALLQFAYVWSAGDLFGASKPWALAFAQVFIASAIASLLTPDRRLATVACLFCFFGIFVLWQFLATEIRF